LPPPPVARLNGQMLPKVEFGLLLWFPSAAPGENLAVLPIACCGVCVWCPPTPAEEDAPGEGKNGRPVTSASEEDDAAPLHPDEEDDELWLPPVETPAGAAADTGSSDGSAIVSDAELGSLSEAAGAGSRLLGSGSRRGSLPVAASVNVRPRLLDPSA